MRHSLVSMALVAMFAAVAVAQEVRAPQKERDDAAQPQPRQEQTAQRVDPSAESGENNLDKPIAACLILGSAEEVALAEFAESRIQNEQVKQFAQQMIKEHQQAITQLKQFAPQKVSLKLDGEASRETQTRPRDAAQNRATEREGQDRTKSDQTAQAGGQHDELLQQALQMQRAIAQECLNLTQQELSEKEGPKFDQCYIGQQIGAHVGMLAKLTGSEQFASAELQPVLQQQRQTVEQHLQHAKKLAQQLEGESQTAERRTENRRETE